MHRYDIWYDTDGDYVCLLKLDGYWHECARWMIPGTWIEEDPGEC
jgi:hypothetical protein